MFKTSLKRTLLRVMDIVGHIPLPDTERDWLCRRFCPRLLDPRVLPRQLYARRLRGLPVTVLCNPYIYSHRNTYWFGYLYDVGLDRYLRSQLQPGDSVIDIGCHIGHLTTLAAALVGDQGHVFAFDPRQDLVKMAKEHCAAQKLNQVSVFSMGLSGQEGQATVHVDPNRLGAGRLGSMGVGGGSPTTTNDTTVNIDIRRGDDVMGNLNFTGRVFARVSVEGREPDVIRGMPQLLTDVISHMMVEVTPGWVDGVGGLVDLFAMMNDHGFEAKQLLRSGKVGDTLLPYTVRSTTNVLFIKFPELDDPYPVPRRIRPGSSGTITHPPYSLDQGFEAPDPTSPPQSPAIPDNESETPPT